MADFKRGIEAGVVTGIIYMVIAAILGAIYHSLTIPPLPYGARLTPFIWRLLTYLSSVTNWPFQYIVRGIVFGAVFAALYSFLPITGSVKKGVVLSAFVWILSAVGLIYITPGWPTGSSIFWAYCGGGAVVLSSISQALVSIISVLVFGALTGFLWDRFRGKRVAEAGKGSPILLLSFILGGVTWVIVCVLYVISVVTEGFPLIEPVWRNILVTLVAFIGPFGWVLSLVAWRKTKRGESGYKWGMYGGVIMALSGFMLFPGALAITGGVFSGRKPARELSTAAIAQ